MDMNGALTENKLLLSSPIQIQKKKKILPNVMADLMWKTKASNKTAFGRYGSIMTVSHKRVCFPVIMKKKIALNLQIKIHALYCRCLNNCSKKIITSAILSGAPIANISFLIFSQTAASKLLFFMLILHY